MNTTFSECVLPTVKFGGGGIKVWGCFSWYGLGPLISVQGKLKAVGYETVLDNSALPTVWQQFREGPFLFQHDNAPVYQAASIQDWFDDMCVELDWPAQRPNFLLLLQPYKS